MDKKVKKFVESLDEVLYYDREANVSVCLLVNPISKEVMSRGLSICSVEDQYIKKVGRNKARGKAVQSIVHKKNIDEIKSLIDAYACLSLDGIFGRNTKWFKGTYRPIISDYEEELIGRKYNPVKKDKQKK